MLENFVGYSTVQYATSELLQDFIFMQIKLISKKGFALTVASFWKRELLELKNGIFNQFESAKHITSCTSRGIIENRSTERIKVKNIKIYLHSEKDEWFWRIIFCELVRLLVRV